MARAKIEVGIDQFLKELKNLFGQNAKKVTAGMGMEMVVIPAELANWVVASCDKFLELEEPGGPSEVRN